MTPHETVHHQQTGPHDHDFADHRGEGIEVGSVGNALRMEAIQIAIFA
jgi:hypothetical protein